MNEKLLRGIISQALEDYLRFRLNKPLTQEEEELDEETAYEEAVQFLGRRPEIVRVLTKLGPVQLEKLLAHLEDTQWNR